MGIIITCITLVACFIWGGAFAFVMAKGEAGADADKTMYVIQLVATWFPLCLWTLKKAGDRYLIYFRNVGGSFLTAMVVGFVFAFIQTRLTSRGNRVADAHDLAQGFMSIMWILFIPILGTITFRMKVAPPSVTNNISQLPEQSAR